MSNEDARSLPGAAQAALRKRAVQAVLDGMTQAEAARVFGVHPNAVSRWVGGAAPDADRAALPAGLQPAAESGGVAQPRREGQRRGPPACPDGGGVDR